MGNLEQAFNDSNNSLNLNPAKGKEENAFNDFQSSLKIDPENLDLELDIISERKDLSRVLAFIENKIGNCEKALENLDKAIKFLQDSMTMVLLVERASVYFSISRLEGALMD
ncbi:10001_t:CDS:2 [Dentiscutata erythropus]|uniref:10001_t:CDS:1 n=1 Tax=Dentiscutata erythropus TaxID=1348616 RepID=A0A9N9DJS9_9GLOM|nr:10001_t:CDS:2 [Dentiscutata erythropus]